jgi:hypothetical protein
MVNTHKIILSVSIPTKQIVAAFELATKSKEDITARTLDG